MTKARMLLDSIERRSLADVKACLAAGASADGSRWRRIVKRHEPTPLIAAVRAGALDIVGLLLDHGANPDLDTAIWETPLALACSRGYRAIAEFLVERGANVNGGTTRHGGPLERAAWYAQEDLVALLLERGADPQRVMARGPASLCRIRDPILRRLIDAGGHAPPEILEMLAAKRQGDSSEGV
jgi:ankyrin repeat protein